MLKMIIKNRKEQKIVVVVEEGKLNRGLVFVMHGHGGYKEQSEVQTATHIFHTAGFSAVLFDTTNSYGESDGKFEDSTFTSAFHDLEDVIVWAKRQAFYREPFVLVGHSMGGMCVALYAEQHVSEVKGLALLAGTVSGPLSTQLYDKRELEEWKKIGIREFSSTTRPGLIHRLKWQYIEDRLKYDLLPEARRLVMPVLQVIGDQDRFVPAAHQKLLYDLLPGRKELHVISGAGHNFSEPGKTEELRKILAAWVQNLGN
ncbi:MAG: alpha/beta hydrolase [Candidatus Veblenbacteria bacterium]|nr:alpha/beta hydrolase [Candidatus Veblenbacteria bacterium]